VYTAYFKLLKLKYKKLQSQCSPLEDSANQSAMTQATESVTKRQGAGF
jgi:hypothetical protein